MVWPGANVWLLSNVCLTVRLFFYRCASRVRTSRYTRQVWAETADAHEAATAVSARSPSRRNARADLPAPPVDSERAFPRRRPPAARPSPAPCYASWALPGTARALARPIAVSSRAEGLDTDAARLPMPLVDSEGTPSRSAARAEDRDLRPLHVPFSRRTSTLARRETPFPKIPRVHARNDPLAFPERAIPIETDQFIFYAKAGQS